MFKIVKYIEIYELMKNTQRIKTKTRKWKLIHFQLTLSYRRCTVPSSSGVLVAWSYLYSWYEMRFLAKTSASLLCCAYMFSGQETGKSILIKLYLCCNIVIHRSPWFDSLLGFVIRCELIICLFISW